MRAYKHPALVDIAIEDVFHALSDPARLSIVVQLAKGEANCAALDCGRPKSTTSHHLRVLRDAGLVHTRADGVVHINTLRRTELDSRFPGLMAAVLHPAKTKGRSR